MRVVTYRRLREKTGIDMAGGRKVMRESKH
jgi:hypothetical protein